MKKAFVGPLSVIKTCHDCTERSKNTADRDKFSFTLHFDNRWYTTSHAHSHVTSWTEQARIHEHKIRRYPQIAVLDSSCPNKTTGTHRPTSTRTLTKSRQVQRTRDPAWQHCTSAKQIWDAMHQTAGWNVHFYFNCHHVAIWLQWKESVPWIEVTLWLLHIQGYMQRMFGQFNTIPSKIMEATATR